MTWLFVPTLRPSTSCPCAPVSADSSSASALPNPARAQSLTWRGKPLPPQAWSRRWRQGGFIRHLSGLTLPVSTLDRGVAAFIASLPVTRASPTASPERAQGPTTTGSSSTRSSASSPSAGLIVCSARTSRGTPTGSSPPSSRHWKRWVTALRQEYSLRPASVPVTGESDCSSWPTPMAGTPAQNGNNAAGNSDFSRRTMDLHAQWRTPSDISKRGGSQHPDKRIAGGHVVNLEDQAEHWATPCARDHFPPHAPEYVAAKKAQGHGMRNLNDEAAHWPTPQLGNRKSRRAMTASAANGRRSGGGQSSPPGLEQMAELMMGDVPAEMIGIDLPPATAALIAHWPTPAARDFKGANSPDHVTTNGTGRAHMDQLPNFVAHAFPSSPPDPQTPDGPPSSDTRRSLNPLFVEWLMGWPTGLSGFARSATVFAPWLQRMRGALCRLCSPVEPEQGVLL